MYNPGFKLAVLTLCVFDGSVPHYGKSFLEKPRITLSFKKIVLRLGQK